MTKEPAECKSCGRIARLSVKGGACSPCRRRERFDADPEYAAKYRAREADWKRLKRSGDAEWANRVRERDRARIRAYHGQCSQCPRQGVVAKGMCRTCYNREKMKEYRLRSPEKVKAANERQLRNARINSLVIRLIKREPCEDCGHLFPPEAIDFDHVRGTKRFNLSSSGGRRPLAVIDEIAKCDIICANCHRIRTRGRAKGNGMC